MSILKVNDIRRATTGSSTLVFNDPVTITSGTISASVLIGSLPGTVTIGDGTIGKEKLTNDARDWVNILNKPSGLLSSSAQIPGALSGSSIAVTNITSSGNITATGYFSGSGAYLYDIPNSALNNSTITINGVVTALGASRTLVTADVSESINLYYTDARVKSKLNTEGVFSSSGQVNYQAVQGQPSVNTLGSDGNNSFTVTAGIFLTGSTGISLTADSPNAKIILQTVGGTVSSSAQVKANLPADTVSSSTQVKAFLPGGSVSSSIQTVANIISQNINPAQITASGHIVPAVSDTIDLGSPTAKFRDLYLSGSTLYLGTLAIKDANGTLVVTTSGSSTPSPASGSYTGSFTGSFNGTFPYASLTGIPSGIASGSIQVKAYLPADTVSSSVQVKNFLPDGSVSASVQVDVRNTTGIATIATTGSNIFVGNQTISGSTTITGNLTVQGTSSVLYVTSSQLDVGSNRLTLNTTALLRYGGINVYDSGSLTNQSGSLLWDSINNIWLFVHAGSSNTSSIVITGPENTGALGNEAFLTTNLLPKAGLHGDHIVDSQISDNGTHVGIAGSLRVTGSITASAVSGALTGTFPYTSLTSIPSGIVSSSTQVQPLLPAGTVSSSGQVDYNSITNKLSGVYSSSTQTVAAIANQTIAPTVVNTTTITATNITASFISGAHTGTFPYGSLTGIPAGIVSSSTQVQPLLPGGTVSSSGQVTATSTTGFTAGVEQVMKDNNVHSASFLGTATTNNLSEGFTNLYYTDARVKTKLNVEAVHSGSSLGTATTTNLPEGTNQYFTNARVIAALPINTVSSSNQVNAFLPAGTVSSSAQVNLSQAFSTASQALTASYALVTVGTTATNTDGLPEGSTNLYYTDARVKTKLNADNVHSASFLGTATTTNLTEGINLYFTNQRVVNALPIGTVSSSGQLPVLLPAGTVSSSGQVTISSTTGYSTFSSSIATKNDTQDISINALNAATSSYAINSTIQTQLAGVVSSSAQVKPLLPSGTVSSSAQYPGWVTASSQIDYNSIQNKLSGVVSSSTQVQPLLPAGTVSSSGQVDYNSITNKLSGVYSSSTQAVAAIAGQTIAPSTINATGAISGASIQTSGNGIILGNVGIGTSSPGVLLDITGSTPTARVVGAAGTTPKLTLSSAGVTAWSFRTSGSDSSFRLDQDGNDRITVLSGGNVGIGTTSPAQRLHVSSSTNRTPIAWNSSDSNAATGYLYGDTTTTGIKSDAGSFTAGTNFIGVDTANFAVIYTSGSEKVRVTSTGNVGIGTTSPSTKLHVAGGSAANRISVGSNTAGETGGIILYGTSTKYNWSVGAQQTVDNGFEITPSTAVGGTTFSTPALTIAGSTSNVGIGTTSPSDKLHVEGQSVLFRNATSDVTHSLGNSGYGWKLNYSSGKFTWFTNTTDRMVLDNNGNLGIGTTSPVTNFEVRGIIASSISNFTYSTFDGFTDGNLYITANAGSANTTNSNIIFRSSTSGGSITERVRIDNSGNVGIGTATPNAKLDINGNTIVTGSLTVTGRTEIAQVREKLNTKTGATGTVTHDYSTGAIFYHSSIAANFTINLTNVPTDNDKTIAVTVILNQGVTGYYPSAFQIDGSAQTLRWANNETPTPSTSKVDVATFSLIRTGGAWIVLGNYTPFA